MALIAKGRDREAIVEAQKLRSLNQTKMINNLEVLGVRASKTLEIARRILLAKIASFRGNDREAVAQLKRAVEIEGELPYTEPPYWYSPVQQYLGAVLLKSNRPDRAEKVYREALVQNPNSGWSLFGLVQSLQMQGKTARAVEIQRQFKKAWAKADVMLSDSQF